MKPIQPDERRVVNIYASQYKPWINADGSDSGTSILTLNEELPFGTGFHVYKMAPGTSSEPHEHNGNEEFLVLDGELTDNDGTVYRKGDLVWLKGGTQHWSSTEQGCLLAVYIPRPEHTLKE
jgi:quercetin dioxygenase-like cupin family protein